MSLTRPRSRPSRSCTWQPSTSLRRTSGSGDVVDDMFAGPALEVMRCQVFGVDGDAHGRPDLVGEPDRDPRPVASLRTWVQRVTGALQPSTEAAALQAVCEQAWPGGEGGDVDVAVVGDVEFQVIDVAAGSAVSVE